MSMHCCAGIVQLRIRIDFGSRRKRQSNANADIIETVSDLTYKYILGNHWMKVCAFVYALLLAAVANSEPTSSSARRVYSHCVLSGTCWGQHH